MTTPSFIRTNTYVWDAKNMLVSMSGGAAAFTYDSQPRRERAEIFPLAVFMGLRPARVYENWARFRGRLEAGWSGKIATGSGEVEAV